MPDGLLINWSYLAIALLTLWFPRQWMRLGRIFKKRRRQQRELFDKFAQEGGQDPDNKSVRLGRELINKRNYLDLFRALVGGWALWHYSFEATTPDGREAGFLVGVLVSVAAVLIQGLRYKEKLTFFAPLFFLCGLSVGLGVPYAGACAFLLTCAINPIIPNPRMFLTAYGLVLLPFNYLFDSPLSHTVLNSALILLLPLLSLMVGRPVVIFTKKANLG